MTEPVFDESTQRLYDYLPDTYRSEDNEQNWLLKKWLTGIGVQIDEIQTLLDRFSYVPPEDGPGYRTSDLVDPDTADAAWLPWLAQLVGMKLDTSLTVPNQRIAVKNSILGLKAGSKAAMAAAAATVLVGSKEVTIYDHSDGSNFGGASQWDMTVVTNDTETLDNALPVDQATFTSTNGFTSDSWFVNLGGGSWTSTGMTASTGSTNPLLAAYDTFSGAGNTYVAAVAIPGAKYEGSVMLRCLDGLATSADLVIEFMNGGSSLTTTTVSVTGLGANWQKVVNSAVAPANTTHVRMKLVRAATGVLHVSNKMISPGGTKIYFDSSFVGAGTEDTSQVTYPLVNFWRNGSFDVAGGHTSSNGTLTSVATRFKNNNSGGLFEVTGATPTITPTQTVPTYEGEQVYCGIWVLGFQNDGQARLEIRFTKTDGTTQSTFGSWTNLNDLDFMWIELNAPAPQNAKSCQVYIQFSDTVGYRYYLDGGLIVRVQSNLGYFDGNMAGSSWTDVNHANAVSVRGSTLPANIVTESFVPDSNSLLCPVFADKMVVKAQMNPSRSAITVVAADPWTFMLSVYANQPGDYYLVFQVIYLNGSNVETGRSSAGYNLTTAQTPLAMVIQSTIPASSTQARMRVYIYGGNRGDSFGVTRAGARQGQVSNQWVAVSADPIAAIIAAGVKPAGVILHDVSFSASWADIESTLPTWADWEGKTWQQIEETGI